MPSGSYNKADIPRELQRLIDHTDRGIEQLYQLAGHNARVTEKISRSSKRQLYSATGRQRDSYYDSRHHDPAPQLEEEEEEGDSDAGSDEDERATYGGDAVGNSAADSRLTRRSHVHREKGKRNAGPLRQVHRGPPVADAPQPLSSRTATSSRRLTSLQRDAQPLRSSPLSTPTRTPPPHRLSPGDTFASSPASLETAPRWQQADLPSPSSFLSGGSLPNLSSSSQRLPPWQQRQHESGRGRHRANGVRAMSAHHSFSPSSSPSHHSPSRARATRIELSPASTAVDDAAYTAYLRGQQSTQRPDADGGAAAARPRRHRSLRFDSSVMDNDEDEEEEEEDVVGVRLEGRFSDDADRGGSAGMLSRFGKRWGAVFEGMLSDVPPAPTSVKNAAATPRRKDGTTQHSPSSSPSSSPPTADERAGVSPSTRAEPQAPEGAAWTSASVHAAAAAIAARHGSPSPLHSRAPSANVSGLLVPASGEKGSGGGNAAPHSARPPPPPQHPTASSPPSSSSLLLAALSPSSGPQHQHQHRPTPPQPSETRLVEQLRLELKAKDEAMLQLRMDHAREMAEVRQAFHLERTAATKHTADELAATFAVQQQMLQTSLQTERERVAEAEEQLRMTRREAAQRKLDLEDAAHALEVLQRKHAALTTAHQEATAQSAQWRSQAESAAAASRQLEAQDKVWRAKEADWLAKEADWQSQLQHSEERLTGQEAAAQEVLAQVEAEFTQTSQSYQDLLAEATKRMSYLEKSHRKYKLLKESHTLLKDEHAQLVEATVQRTQQHENEVKSLRSEVQELRQQLHQRDSASQEASASYQETLRDYQRRLELQEASTGEHMKSVQQHLDTANHTVELLRTQLEATKQELLEEQGRSQQLQMAAAQAELRAQEAMAEQQQAAAAYQVRTEDTLAQQRRQLREKDAKLQALAASANEPLQRLRQQLEDERGRRARVEEQLKTYKRKAKEAEEHAAAEIRREQLRNALRTPAGAAVSFGQSATPTNSAHQRLLRSATATPSLQSTATTRRVPSPSSSAVASAGSGAAGAAVPGERAAVRLGSATHSSPPHTPAAQGVVVKASAGAASAADAVRLRSAVQRTREEGGGSGGSDEEEEDEKWAGQAVGGHRWSNREAAPPAEGTGAARRPSPTTRGQQRWRGRQAEQREPTSRLPSPSTGAAVSAPVLAKETSMVSASATVQSLSGISPTSPCVSTLLGEGDAANGASEATAARLPGRGRRNERREEEASSERSDDSDGEAAGQGEDATTRELPWYARRTARRRPLNSPESGVKEEDRAGDLPATPDTNAAPPAAPLAVATAAGTDDSADAGWQQQQQHEERMRTFHSSALEVMRRFAGSRREALARCADIVKQTAAEQRRGTLSQRREGGGGGGGRMVDAEKDVAVSTDLSESDSDAP